MEDVNEILIPEALEYYLGLNEDLEKMGMDDDDEDNEDDEDDEDDDDKKKPKKKQYKKKGPKEE